MEKILIKLRMIWLILTHRNVSLYCQDSKVDTEYETTARDNVAANMACNMCMLAKSRKYRTTGKKCSFYEELK